MRADGLRRTEVHEAALPTPGPFFPAFLPLERYVHFPHERYSSEAILYALRYLLGKGFWLPAGDAVALQCPCLPFSFYSISGLGGHAWCGSAMNVQAGPESSRVNSATPRNSFFKRDRD